MIRQKLELINIATIRSAKDTLTRLGQLDAQLAEHNLSQFKVFNTTYILVTTSIHQAIKNRYFENPEFIEKVLVEFAQYYFLVINKCYNNDPSIPAPWAKLNDYAALKSAPTFMSLMIGANAHINDDLPRVLYSHIPTKKTKGLLRDLAKINKLLMQSGKKAIYTFDEKNKFYNFLKRHLVFIYYRPAMFTILHWRLLAWKNYTMLRKNKITPQDITNKSTKIANRLLTIARLLS
ncbi:MAG TPA: DUF5995 family protein [Candidatus Saccharimonadales bacterium]